MARQPGSSTPASPPALVASRYCDSCARKGGRRESTFGQTRRKKEKREERGAGPLREGASAPRLQVAACMPMRRFPCRGSGGGGGGGGAEQQEGPLLTLSSVVTSYFSKSAQKDEDEGIIVAFVFF